MTTKAKNMDAITTGNILEQKLKGSGVGITGKYVRIQEKKKPRKATCKLVREEEGKPAEDITTNLQRGLINSQQYLTLK